MIHECIVGGQKELEHPFKFLPKKCQSMIDDSSFNAHLNVKDIVFEKRHCTSLAFYRFK